MFGYMPVAILEQKDERRDGRENGGVDGIVPSLETVTLYSDVFRMSG